MIVYHQLPPTTTNMHFPDEIFAEVIDYLKPRPNPTHCMDTVVQLKSMCRCLRLPVGGRKLDLINRLLSAGCYARRAFWDTPEHAQLWGADRTGPPLPMLTFREVLHSKEAWDAHANLVSAELDTACPGTTYCPRTRMLQHRLPPGWTRVESMSRPGSFYYRNSNLSHGAPGRVQWVRPRLAFGELRPVDERAFQACLDAHLSLCTEVGAKYNKYYRRMNSGLGTGWQHKAHAAIQHNSVRAAAIAPYRRLTYAKIMCGGPGGRHPLLL